MKIADGGAAGSDVAAAAAPSAVTLEQFLCGPHTAWQNGEMRPTIKANGKAKRERPR